MLLYLYDLKIKGKKEYNTLKRRFYYELKQSKLANAPWRTKSVLLVSDELEKHADAFFFEFDGFVEVYKARVTSLEQVGIPE